MWLASIVLLVTLSACMPRDNRVCAEFKMETVVTYPMMPLIGVDGMFPIAMTPVYVEQKKCVKYK